MDWKKSVIVYSLESGCPDGIIHGDHGNIDRLIGRQVCVYVCVCDQVLLQNHSLLILCCIILTLFVAVVQCRVRK